jgi:hypothetical protein
MLQTRSYGAKIMPIDPDRHYSPGDLEALGEGKHTTIFNRIAAGEYGPVFKDGPRTKITGAGILARRERHLKPIAFGSLKGLKSVPPQVAAKAAGD